MMKYRRGACWDPVQHSDIPRVFLLNLHCIHTFMCLLNDFPLRSAPPKKVLELPLPWVLSSYCPCCQCLQLHISHSGRNLSTVVTCIQPDRDGKIIQKLLEMEFVELQIGSYGIHDWPQQGKHVFFSADAIITYQSPLLVLEFTVSWN